MLSRLIVKFGFDGDNVPLNNAVEFAAQCLDSSNNEVRQAASDLILEAYKLIGIENVEPLLSSRPGSPGVRQNIKDALFNRYNDYLEVPQDEEVRGKQTDNRAKRGPSAGKREEQPPGLSKKCGFCGLLNKNFLKEELYDMHLWKECPVLVSCRHCTQVVNISSYTDHLLSQCQAARHKQCPRCKMAILKENYDRHVQEYTCDPSKPLSEASRCPLCSEDIPPGNEGWITHLMTIGCPNNERTITR